MALLAILVLSAALAPGAGAAGGARRALLPPANPRYSLAIARYMWPACTGAGDYSPGCLRSSLAMLNAGRRSEGLGPVMLPDNWALLTVAEQLFVLTELERTARGLPADAGLAAGLSAIAQAGADSGRDPNGGGGGVRSVWAGGEPNAIVVMADWVYADGLFRDGASENLGCSLRDRAGCWSHRDIILHDRRLMTCGSRCLLGAGFAAGGYRAGTGVYGRQSFAEVVAARNRGAGPLRFSWAAERGQLPVCERRGDSCSWAGIPVASPSGIHESRGRLAPGQPWFPVGVHSHLRPGGELTIDLLASVRVVGVSAVATLRSAGRGPQVRRRLSVRRMGIYRFRLRARLRPGRWCVRIRYRMTRRRGYRPQSVLALQAPPLA